MQTLKKVGVILSLAALSVSASWARDGNSFVAKAELDGFKAVPPVLTSSKSEVCLEFKTQESTAATGEALAQVLAGNPGAKNKRPYNEGGDPNNIRLYFGQPFAHGPPIATLCDNAIRNLECTGTSTPDGDFELVFFDFSDFRLSDIQFPRQQIERGGDFSLTIAGVTFSGYDTPPDFVKGRLRLLDDRDGLTLMKTLIKRGLIYVVEESIEYKPPKPGTVRNGWIRGTLRLAAKASRCPPKPAPDE